MLKIMSKKWSSSFIALTLSSVVILGGCGEKSSETAAGTAPAGQQTEAGATATATGDQDTIKQGTAKLQEETKKLQDAIAKEDGAAVKELGKSINDLWLSYENAVRQAFPLEYTEVEKYEMPIYSASAYDKVDFAALKTTADSLQDALTKLQNAKPSSASASDVMLQAVASYKAFVDQQAEQLAVQTKAFAAAVKAGDIEKAKEIYTVARVHFETIEPIAESFGDLDPRIDARLADMENEADWTGYHRIEKALWVDKSLAGQEKYADQLIKDTEELQQKIVDLKLEPKTMVAGAMELLNEAATSKITGEEEVFSKTDLVDLAANVNGSKTVYLAIIPELNEKNADLGVQLDKAFQTMEETLLKYQENGKYVAYDKLTTEQIREISEQLSQLSNLMSQTASIF
ncbi:iron uptake system protein EfeO [Gorillibacterium massiliense]|uniref:iron uptake system protein EfeO n=1 Tax=Gorillibacterium massiliense TaxID=1280390 RepID=UPI0004B78DB6|nr:iron uptake system protein EfeO [Gorillibacterium massiliense]